MASASSIGQTPQLVRFWAVSLGQGSLNEDTPEYIHMRLYPAEGLADGDKVGDVQHPHWVEMLQL